ncbi:MAG: hypothetical protein JRN20_06540 [Nitrososphaerota archaeon]|nr:hypothetical protein [Nitrososphaerota archaeon]
MTEDDEISQNQRGQSTRRRRSHLELLAETLSVVKQESQPTRIMYTANLSWTVLRSILGHLEEKGLAVKERGAQKNRETWRVTTKGREALNAWDKLVKSFLD